MPFTYIPNKLNSVWLSAFAGFCFLFLMSCSEPEPTFHFLAIDLETQAQQNRYLISPLSNQLFEYDELLFPVLIETTVDGIFILDVADESRVSKFSWDFELEDKIGLGIGEGPGEIRGVNDFHVRGDTLYLSDAGNALIHLFTINNEFVRSISIEDEMPSQITTFRDLLVVRTGSDERPLFIDNNGVPVRQAESISPDETRYRFILESRLFSDNEYLYRLPTYFGFLTKYDQQGTLVAAKNLIDATESLFQDEPSDTENQPPFIQRENAVQVTVSAGFDEDKLCVLRYYREEGDRFIDCYDKSGLDYLFSFIPPDNTADFKIHGDFFTAIHDSSVTVWEWNPQEEF